MKRHLLSIVMLFATCLPISAQLTPVQPLAKKLIVAELKQDFRNFNDKVADMKINKRNQAALASEYSDLIERMDAEYHQPQSTKNYRTAVVVVTAKRAGIDH